MSFCPSIMKSLYASAISVFKPLNVNKRLCLLHFHCASWVWHLNTTVANSGQQNMCKHCLCKDHGSCDRIVFERRQPLLWGPCFEQSLGFSPLGVYGARSVATCHTGSAMIHGTVGDNVVCLCQALTVRWNCIHKSKLVIPKVQTVQTTWTTLWCTSTLRP